MLRRSALAASPILIALALGACGGGHKTTSDRDAYIARADGICRETSVRAGPLLRRLAVGAASLTPASARGLAPLGRRVHQIAGAYIARLSALSPPAADRAEIARFVSLSRQVIDAIGGASAALSAGRTTQALATLQRVQATAGAADAAAAAYGFDDCATVLAIG